MLSKNEIKYIQSLGHKKQRDNDGLFIAEGPKMAGELLNSNFEVSDIYATTQWISNHKHVSGNITEVSLVELERISNLQTPNQVLLIAKQKTLQQEPVLQNYITLVLDGIQDPGNMGTIIRIADWFGISQVVAGMDTAELYNPKVVQSTMGSICRVSVWYKHLEQWLPKIDVPVYGALLHGKSIYNTGFVNEGLLIIGNESKGISKEIIDYITHPVTIPKVGHAESLNAAIATGIILSHLVKPPG